MSFFSFNAGLKPWDLQRTEVTQLGYSINGLGFEHETTSTRSPSSNHFTTKDVFHSIG